MLIVSRHSLERVFYLHCYLSLWLYLPIKITSKDSNSGSRSPFDNNYLEQAAPQKCHVGTFKIVTYTTQINLFEGCSTTCTRKFAQLLKEQSEHPYPHRCVFMHPDAAFHIAYYDLQTSKVWHSSHLFGGIGSLKRKKDDPHSTKNMHDNPKDWPWWKLKKPEDRLPREEDDPMGSLYDTCICNASVMINRISTVERGYILSYPMAQSVAGYLDCSLRQISDQLYSGEWQATLLQRIKTDVSCYQNEFVPFDAFAHLRYKQTRNDFLAPLWTLPQIKDAMEAEKVINAFHNSRSALDWMREYAIVPVILLQPDPGWIVNINFGFDFPFWPLNMIL